MAKIDAYPALTTPADTDLVVMADLGAGNTKKVTRGDFLRYGTYYTEQQAGWYFGGAWTYGSATTINVPAADVAAMNIGTKIRIVQTTTKYFHVVAISGTTITVDGKGTYTVANAAITSPYFSNAESPAGFVLSPMGYGYTQITSNFTTSSTTVTALTGLSVTIIAPTSKQLLAEVYLPSISSTTQSGQNLSIWDGTVGSGTQLQLAPHFQSTAGTSSFHLAKWSGTLSAGSHTLNAGILTSSGTLTVAASSTAAAYIKVKLDK
jgi:hypothetical protein